MNVRQYINKHKGTGYYTFIKARARKDAHTPFYHPEYQTTPIWDAYEWTKDNNAPILESIVLNDRQAPITWLSGADWNNDIRCGMLKCLLIISPDDFKTLYPGETQREHMEQFIEKQLE